MKAAQRLLEMAAQEGVRACFANPGTSEMHLVAALDAAPSIRPVLCLFEGVATGAADGYGRMTQTPALTLLHLGPGLGNGFANLHNAYRARTPIVSLVGEHATYHRANDPPLASDIAAIARPVSAWLETAGSAKDLLRFGRDAIAAAKRLGPATLILPADAAWSDDEPDLPPPVADVAPRNGVWVECAARALGFGDDCRLLHRGQRAGDDNLRGRINVGWRHRQPGLRGCFGTRLGHLRRVQRKNRRHAALACGHSLLHGASTSLHRAYRIGKFKRSGGHVRTPLAQ